jgi:hypothetical protein
MNNDDEWEQPISQQAVQEAFPSSQGPQNPDAPIDSTDAGAAAPAERFQRRWNRVFGAIERILDRRRLGFVLLGLLVSLPIIAAQIQLAGQHWYPGGDMAQAELHVRGLWANPPLVGAAGRIASDSGLQGSHPGPSLWLALWPVYALFGSTSRGLIFSVGVIHIASVLALLWLAGRRGGTSLMVLVALATAILIRASGTDFATEPWNPWLAVIPFGVFVLLCWSLIEGEWKAWPAAVLIGSHCIQCHAGYALVVFAILGISSVIAVLQARWPGALGLLATTPSRGSTLNSLPPESADAGHPVVAATASEERDVGVDATPPRRTRLLGFGSAILAGLAIWTPPLIDHVRRQPGNISILIEHFGSPTESYIGRRDALAIIANQFNLAGPWVQGRESLSVNILGLIAMLTMWGGAILLAVRAQHRSALRMHVLLGAGVLAGCLSVLRLFGGYFEYTVRWWWVLAALIAAVSLWTLWSSAQSSLWRAGSDPAARYLVLVASLAVPLLGAAQFSDRAELPGPAETAIVGGLSKGLVPAVEALNDPTVSRPAPPKYLMRWFDPQYLGSSAFGLVLELERQGIEVGVDPEFSAAALPHRVFAEAEVDGVLYLVVGQRIEQVRQQESAVELAEFDIRSVDDASRSQVVRQELVDRFAEIGRPELADQLDKQYGLTSLIFSPTPLPEDITELVVEYLDLGQPAAVFLVPSGTPLDAVPELTRATG